MAPENDAVTERTCGLRQERLDERLSDLKDSVKETKDDLKELSGKIDGLLLKVETALARPANGDTASLVKKWLPLILLLLGAMGGGAGGARLFGPSSEEIQKQAQAIAVEAVKEALKPHP